MFAETPLGDYNSKYRMREMMSKDYKHRFGYKIVGDDLYRQVKA
jgi:hypothetical protein